MLHTRSCFENRRQGWGGASGYGPDGRSDDACVPSSSPPGYVKPQAPCNVVLILREAARGARSWGEAEASPHDLHRVVLAVCDE